MRKQAAALWVFRTRRILKRAPRRAFRDWIAVLANEGQLFSFVLAILTSWIGLQTASLPEIVKEANGWANVIQAFVYVAAGWAVICLLRAPAMIHLDEKHRGRWHGNRFVYNQPELVATLRCKATGRPQFHEVIFHDAEPEAFVYYTLTLEGDLPKHLYSAHMVNHIVMDSWRQIGSGAGRGGLVIGKRREASLLIVMAESMVSQTVRIYARDFSIGAPVDQDGETGDDPVVPEGRSE